jgi:hypothetical protein
LYEITEPYVAEFCQPRIALKIPQPPPPFNTGFPNFYISAKSHPWSISLNLR